jgi:acetylornithine deacetylase/succinyl-diaminopimelate desuccinylase-like protein
MPEFIDTYIHAEKGRFIEELKELLRFPSISAQRDHDGDCLACARWVRDHFAGLGLEAELIDQGGKPIVLARSKGSGGQRVAIYGHYDVQPEDPLDQWNTGPFDPVIHDDVIYARGASDDKGQFFIHVKAIEALVRTQGTLPCEVVFLLEGEEESGGDALGRYVRSAGRDLKPDVLIISDGDMYDTQTPAVTYGLRGIFTFEMAVKGPAHDLHSGSYGGIVANPALVLTQILSQCVSSDGKIVIPHFYDEVIPLKEWEIENINKLQYDDQLLIEEAQVPGLHGETGFSNLERLWARPTFEINGIYGGYQGQRTKTIIPGRATTKVSMRLVPNQDPTVIRERVFAYLRSICPDTVTLELTDTGGGPPVVFDINTPVMHAAIEALHAGFGVEPVFIRTGGSIPVVRTFSEQWGCPVLLLGFGQDSDGAHSPNEHFSLDSFIKGIRASAHLLCNMG